MKTIGLRTLYKEAATLTEEVLVTQDRRVIGRFTPSVTYGEVHEISPGMLGVTETKTTYYGDAPMDENVKKAIEPDRVKITDTPKGPAPTKGLGEVPGLTQRDPFQEFRPAPKPGKK